MGPHAGRHLGRAEDGPPGRGHHPASWTTGKFCVRDRSIITGRRGLRNGKVAGPKLFAPTLKTGSNFLCPTLLNGGNFLHPLPPPPFSMAKISPVLKLHLPPTHLLLLLYIDHCCMYKLPASTEDHRKNSSGAETLCLSIDFTVKYWKFH